MFEMGFFLCFILLVVRIVCNSQSLSSLFDNIFRLSRSVEGIYFYTYLNFYPSRAERIQYIDDIKSDFLEMNSEHTKRQYQPN